MMFINTDYLIDFVIPQGPTGPQGPSQSLDTYAMAILTTENEYDYASPILFNDISTIHNITYSKDTGTFTFTNAGQYLINWSASIKNEGPTSILSLGLYQASPNATYVAYSNTGNTISKNASTLISGTALITASANSTYQLRNISSQGQSISTVTYDTVAATITIARIN